MNLPTLNNLDVSEKIVLLRGDLDVRIVDGRVIDDIRLEVLFAALEKLLKNGARKVIVLGHLGRPGGKKDESLSLSRLVPYFREKFNLNLSFVDYQPFKLFYIVHDAIFRTEKKAVLLENIRFWKEEEEESEDFARELAYLGEVYVNEAFAASHRKHVSVTTLAKVLLSRHPFSAFLGDRFSKEVENLSRVFVNPKRPVVAIISGVKEDKLSYINDLKRFSDKILVGGRLPEFYYNSEDPNTLVAELTTDKLDLSEYSIKIFEEQIARAGTIVLSGPLGKFEDLAHREGTRRVLRAISSNTHAFKVAGGGDTERAISEIGFAKAFDWISVGGGAMLEFLAKGTLPGIEALLN